MTASSNQVAIWLSSGEDFLTQGDYTQALVAFAQALDLAQQSQNPQAEVIALQRLGHAHLGQGEPTLSVASIEQAITIALEQHNLNALYECHRQLAEVYKSTSSFELALQHLETAEGLRDRLAIPALASTPLSTPGGCPTATPSPIMPGLAVQSKAARLRLFCSILERAPVGVAIFQAGHLVYGNPCLMQWVGYSSPELWHLTLADLVALPPGQDTFSLQPTTAGPRTGQLRCKAGTAMDVEIYTAPINYGDRPALVTFLHDVTEAQRLADRLKESASRYRSLIDHVPMGLCRFSIEGRPLDANPALLSIFDCDTVPDFLQASPIQPSSLVSAQGQPIQWGDYLSQPDNQPGSLKDCEIKLTRPNGRDLWVRVIARAIANDHGTLHHYDGAVEDITEIKAAQIALEELAMRDSLTHVYNRRHFIDLASREIVRSARFNHPVTLLMIDIDHFKTVNDTYGHLAGDAVLRDVALRLKANLRQSDILARYGGEEFILLMPETDSAQAWIGAERLRRVIAATPFNTSNGTIAVTASLGLSCWPANTDPNAITSLPQINDLISRADQALYRAKQSGRNQTQVEIWLYSASSQTA